MAEVLLSPLVDFLFKRIFGDEKNTDLLVHFLNAVFEEAGEPLVESVEILNPYIDKDALTDKMSVLDIRARTQARTLVDVAGSGRGRGAAAGAVADVFDGALEGADGGVGEGGRGDGEGDDDAGVFEPG